MKMPVVCSSGGSSIDIWLFEDRIMNASKTRWSKLQNWAKACHAIISDFWLYWKSPTTRLKENAVNYCNKKVSQGYQ